MKKQSNNNAGKVIAVTAGIAAVSAAAYLLFGPDAKKNQKNLKGWMLKMKGEVVEKIEGMKEITEEAYQDVVDKIAAKYREMKNVDPEELGAEIKKLQKQWREIKKKHSPKKTARKTAKKASKK
jgi:hypothetical protein